MSYCTLDEAFGSPYLSEQESNYDKCVKRSKVRRRKINCNEKKNRFPIFSTILKYFRFVSKDIMENNKNKSGPGGDKPARTGFLLDREFVYYLNSFWKKS